MHGGKSSPRVVSDINLLRYRERLGLTYAEALNEPAVEVTRALLIWELEDKRAKLEADKQELNKA